MIASAKPAYRPGRVCMRVLTTSSGTTSACVSAQPSAPLNAKSPYSVPPSFRSPEIGARATVPKTPGSRSGAGSVYRPVAASSCGTTLSGSSSSGAAARLATTAAASNGTAPAGLFCSALRICSNGCCSALRSEKSSTSCAAAPGLSAHATCSLAHTAEAPPGAESRPCRSDAPSAPSFSSMCAVAFASPHETGR